MVARQPGLRIVALALVTISVGLGLTMAGRWARKPGLPRVLTAIHEQTAVTALAAIVVHGVTLLGDPWLNPGPTGIPSPSRCPTGRSGPGWGSWPATSAPCLGSRFYIRRRIGPRLWRQAHRFTVVVYALAVAHTLGAGTDASTPWMRIWLFATAPVIASSSSPDLSAHDARGRARRRPGGRLRSRRVGRRATTFPTCTSVPSRRSVRIRHEGRRSCDRRRGPGSPALRQRRSAASGYEAPIRIVCAETEPPYDRPPLSKELLAGAVDEEAIALRPHDWYEKNQIELILGRRAVGLDVAAGGLALDDGRPSSFDSF